MKKYVYKLRIILSFFAVLIVAGSALAMKPKPLPTEPPPQVPTAAPAVVPAAMPAPKGKTKAEIQLGVATGLRARFEEAKDPKHLLQAVELYEAAADAGIAQAMWELGELYATYTGLLGLDADVTALVKTLQLWTRAAENGHPQAQRYLQGHRASTIEKAKEGDAKAQYLLVHVYTDGTEEQKLIATLSLGRAYLTGKGIEKDLKKAEKFLKIAAEGGNPIAVYLVARYFPSGDLQRHDLHAAAFRLGLAFLGGEGVTADLEKAKKYLEEAANMGNIRALVKLGDIYLREGDNQIAAAYYIRAVEAGDFYGLLTLGRLYAEGVGVRRNMQEAVRLFQRAVERRVPGAQAELDLAEAQLDAENGAAPDRQEATIDLGMVQAPGFGLGLGGTSPH